MTNGLVLHAGATVVELLPPIMAGCPCGMYQGQFRAERHLLHYTASTVNRSAAVRTGAKNTWGTYNSDFMMPVEVSISTTTDAKYIVLVGPLAKLLIQSGVPDKTLFLRVLESFAFGALVSPCLFVFI